MPIKRELRHLYRGPAWRATRDRILARAEHRCERCGKPDRQYVFVTRDGSGRWWLRVQDRPAGVTVHVIRCVLTIAHLNHDAFDNREENLAALCQWCHLHHDRHFHHANARRTIAARHGQTWLSPEIEAGARP